MPFAMDVQVTLRQVSDEGQYFGNNELRISETVSLPALDFAQVADILARFHALSESIKGKHE